MNRVLAGLSGDPRATLTPGFQNAGEAVSNLRRVTSQFKPAGFFDPANPAQLQPLKPADKQGKSKKTKKGAEPPKPEFTERGSLLDFANTDMAFAGDVMVAGSFHGFNVYRLGADGAPQLVSSTVCPGGQGDVSIVGRLLIMSVEEPRGRTDCGLQGVLQKVSAERFRGIRIFDISDITQPRQVGQVQTCRGSHTHSVVDADPNRIVVYVSGTSYVRNSEELAGCVDIQGDDRTARFSIDVIEIPVASPAAARIIDRPRVFAAAGQIAGLWRGGDHGDNTQDTYVTDQCHDITVFPAKRIAAGACSGNGILLDISDPLHPRRIDEVSDKTFAYWHSATFNNDGSKILFSDEWGGGSQPKCRKTDKPEWGADAIFTIAQRNMQFQSYYKLPAPQTPEENCVAHNGSLIPIPGRDVMVQSWYQGGISVFDWTDPKHPREIAFFDRGPVDSTRMASGGYWSSYWYNGVIVGSEISRGLDIFELKPSGFISQNEIEAAKSVHLDYFNAQGQVKLVWPATFSLARAYVDQLERSNGLDAGKISAVREAVAGAEKASGTKRQDALTQLATRLDSDAAGAGDAAKVRTLAGVVRQLGTSPGLARP
jgi:hypothetical protein